MQAWARGLMHAQCSSIIREFIFRPKGPSKKAEDNFGRETILERMAREGDEFDLKESTSICPECDRALKSFDFGDYEVCCCVRCRSLWLERESLRRIIGGEKDIPSDHLKSRPSKYKCPECAEIMTEYVFKAPDNLLVDRCDVAGHGVYFENGEIRRALEAIQD